MSNKSSWGEGCAVEAARGFAARMASCSPLALAASLEMSYRSLEMAPFAQALDPHNFPRVMTVLASEDASEGRRAFLAKRAPRWQGR